MSTAFSNIFPSFQAIWPVVQRELRVGAQSRFNNWLRVITGVVGVLIFYFGTEANSSTPSQMGAQIFIELHTLVVVLLLITIPAMTADCIAREKREGTLGLLFMTPLTAEGIVIGKCLVQALRAWGLWLSILPVLTIPLLLGGITWINIAAAIILELCVAFLALAAGLLIASVTQVRILAVILAEITALIFTILFAILLTVYLDPGLAAGPSRFYVGVLPYWIRFMLGLPEYISIQPGIRQMVMLGALWKCLFLTPLVTFLSIRIAAWHIKQNWRDKTPSRRQQWWIKRFCTELGKDAFHQKMQRTLDWNPIAFLQQYSWKNRLSKWGLCLVFIIIQCAFRDQLTSIERMTMVQFWLLASLAAMFTFVGVSSFLAEKQNGALELILITPLHVNQIIIGRAWGLWKQFLPALLSLLLFHFAVIWIHFGYLNASYRSPSLSELFIIDWVVIMGFLSLPFFATYAALRVKYILGAALLTWIGLFLGTAFGFTLATFLNHGNFYIRDDIVLVTLCLGLSYAAFVGLTFFLLRHSLSRRIYSF